MPPSVHQCDSLAADSDDRRNTSGQGVTDAELSAIGYEQWLAAIEACKAAVADFPGDVSSEYQLARLQLLRTGAEDVLSEGRVSMTKLAEGGYAAAQMAMGKLAADRDEDNQAAVSWFLKAAAQADIRAMAEVAKLGLIDKHPSIDREQAIGYLNESLKSNYWGAFLLQSSLYYTGAYYSIDDKEAAIASIKAIRFGGTQPVLDIRYKVELWNEDYRRFIQEQLSGEGVYDGPVDGQDIPATLEAIKLLAKRHASASLQEPKPTTKEPAPAQKGENAESVWAVIQNNQSVAVLEAFIKKFPQSFYAELAKARVDELNAGR